MLQVGLSNKHLQEEHIFVKATLYAVNKNKIEQTLTFVPRVFSGHTEAKIAIVLTTILNEVEKKQLLWTLANI